MEAVWRCAKGLVVWYCHLQPGRAAKPPSPPWSETAESPSCDMEDAPGAAEAFR
jgi:hypothetical protein